MALCPTTSSLSRLGSFDATETRHRPNAIDAKRHAQYAIGALEAWRAADASTKQASAPERRDGE